jgi:hypothetical protein
MPTALVAASRVTSHGYHIPDDIVISGVSYIPGDIVISGFYF